MGIILATYSCPICSKKLKAVERYPRYVCVDCVDRASSKEGRRVQFSNAGPQGGYVGSYADNQEPYESHECYIDGIQCYADEARYGGIVVEVVQ